MQCHATPVHMQPTVHYTTYELSPRDSLLFRTLLRLLKERLLHAWSYEPEQPHLLVQGDSPLSMDTERQERPAALTTLLVGVTPRGRTNYLCMPMRPEELLVVLNELGAQILRTLATMPVLPPAVPMPMQQTSTSKRIEADNCRVQLKRWPSQNLLKPYSRTKLATLILSRPMTALDLSQRSGQSLHECISMMEQLQQENLLIVSWNKAKDNTPLQSTEMVLTAQPKPAVQPGLLARIRLRLGLS